MILASECYVTRTAIQHRYIIVELWHDNHRLWMRLDRNRPLDSTVSFLIAGLSGAAHDTVSSLPLIGDSLRDLISYYIHRVQVEFAFSKAQLVSPRSSLENRQQMLRPLMLGEMAYFLGTLSSEFKRYNLFTVKFMPLLRISEHC